jgi:MFS family permease
MEQFSDAQVRRNALLLALAVGVGGGNGSINIALGGIVGGLLAPSLALATVPVTAFVVGAFLTSLPISLLMARIGRKAGFMLGAAIGAAGGLIAAAAVLQQSFWLFTLGTLLCGSYHGCNQLYRFAVADGASAAYRPKAISLVMAGGLLSAIVGPQLVIHTRGLVPDVLFAGPFIAAAAIILLAMIPVALTRFPPPAPAGQNAAPQRPLAEIARSPRFVAAVVAGMIAYSVMNFVMVASPLAMIACGHSVESAALGIQWHIMGMFAPSFFTGHLIARFGVERVVLAGFALLALSAGIAIAGITVAHFWIALTVLGVGWNFAYVGATTMIAALHAPAERGKVQGLNDSLVFGLVALGSLAAGWLQQASGWTAVNLLVFPAVVLAVLALLLARVKTRPAAVGAR